MTWSKGGSTVIKMLRNVLSKEEHYYREIGSQYKQKNIEGEIKLAIIGKENVYCTINTYYMFKYLRAHTYMCVCFKIGRRVAVIHINCDTTLCKCL